MTLAELHLTDPLAATLDRLGWSADDPLVRDTTPTTARGHNLVVVTPPAPGYAVPALAGMLARARAGDDQRGVLALCPGELLAEWGLLVGELMAGSDLQGLVALGPRRATKRLQGRPPDLLVAAPATALELRRRSLLPVDRLAGVLLLWPEQWGEAEALTSLMSDVGRDTQRVIVTSAPAQSAAVIERHAWRAMTMGLPVEEPVPQGPVRTVAVPWNRRVAVLQEVAEAMDPESVAVWTVDRSRHDEIRRALGGLGIPVEVTHRPPKPTEVVVAFDQPSSDRLGELLSVGDVVLLVPPGTESWVTRIAAPRRLLPVPGALEAATEAASRRRGRIERALEHQNLESHLIALAPLFERHDPSAVAAALYQLWIADERTERATSAEPARAEVARVWVGVGRKDEAGPNDLVGLLANELQVDRSVIGRIDIRETYSLIEVPAEAAERIAHAMTGRTVRRRRVVARVDRKGGR